MKLDKAYDVHCYECGEDFEEINRLELNQDDVYLCDDCLKELGKKTNECLELKNLVGRNMDRYVLRWQYGLFNKDVKIHYTYGHIDTLREKAKVLAEDDKILVITLDKVEEVIKDIREEKLIEHMENHKI